jgi:16S rRNA uridine-516 pseudouridylate synthase and related pseudouridylate synthases
MPTRKAADGVRQSAGGLPRLISIGRLDFNTEGLLLLTNDGGLARALELPEPAGCGAIASAPMAR